MNERNGILDFWKYIAAIGVILVHIPFPGVVGNICTAVGILGVCFFFLISGYACYGDSKVMPRKIFRRFRRNGLIAVVTILLYLVFAYVAAKVEHTEFLYKLTLKQPKTYLRMLLLGDFEFAYGSALWFIVALVYCYLLFMLITRLGLRKLVLVALVPLLILRIVVETYVGSFVSASWHQSANALIGALPMMLLGYAIAIWQDKLRFPNVVLIVVTILSAAAVFVAVNVKVAQHYDISQPFKIICSTALFLHAVNNPSRHVCRPIEKLGREDSLYIYLFHFMILVLVASYMYDHCSFRYLAWIVPVVVVVASLVFARILSVVVRIIGRGLKSLKSRGS